jgi:hypothetical protein
VSDLFKQARVMRESDIQRNIIQYLRIRHIPHIVTHGIHVGSGGYRIVRPHLAGVPDIIGCLPCPGRMFQIEVKADSGIVSDKQEEVMREFRQAKALAFVARSVEEAARQIEAAQ